MNEILRFHFVFDIKPRIICGGCTKNIRRFWNCMRRFDEGNTEAGLFHLNPGCSMSWHMHKFETLYTKVEPSLRRFHE